MKDVHFKLTPVDGALSLWERLSESRCKQIKCFNAILPLPGYDKVGVIAHQFKCKRPYFFAQMQ